MISEQRTVRFLRSTQECHDESVQAAIVAISPEEAALLFDPRYQDSCPEIAEELISSSSSYGSSSSSMFLRGNPVRNSEDEMRRETQRLSEELRLAEEEDARLIEVEVQRQLEDLARREYGQMATMSSPVPSVGGDDRRRLEERRSNERHLDDQMQFKRRLEDERRLLQSFYHTPTQLNTQEN